MSDESRQQAITQIEQTIRNCGLLEFAGDVQLLEWQKSTSRDGPKVKFLLQTDEDISPFERATVKKGKQAGQLYRIFAVRIDEDAPRERRVDPSDRPPAARAPETHHANELARKLHVDGYFRNPKLWDAMEAAGVYTQVQHKAWIEGQECLLSLGESTKRKGRAWFVPPTFPCIGDTVGHHCNSAAIPAAGKGENPRKPPHWYLVPLCYVAHHQNWVHASLGAAREDKRMLLEMAVDLTAERMKFHMKRLMNIESLRDVTPALLEEFEQRVGLR